jgi:hypothetical protein
MAEAAPGDLTMDLSTIPLQPAIALIAGILILIMPRLLSFLVALYLIIIGVIGVAPSFGINISL